MTERMARFIAVVRGIRLCSNTYAVEYDRQESRRDMWGRHARAGVRRAPSDPSLSLFPARPPSFGHSWRRAFQRAQLRGGAQYSPAQVAANSVDAVTPQHRHDRAYGSLHRRSARHPAVLQHLRRRVRSSGKAPRRTSNVSRTGAGASVEYRAGARLVSFAQGLGRIFAEGFGRLVPVSHHRDADARAALQRASA